MLYASEQLQPVGQGKTLATEGVNVRVHETAARQLGLRDGQVVQAVVETRGETSRIVLNGQTLVLPPSVRLPHGDTPYFRVLPAASGAKVLHLVRVADAALGADQARPSGQALSGRLLDLLAKPVDMSQVARVLGAAQMERLLAMPGFKPAAALLAGLQSSMAFLDGDAIRRAVAQSGLWTEARLRQGGAPVFDLKQLFRFLLTLNAGTDAQTTDGLGKAIDAIETQQLELLRLQASREGGFSVVLPFFDAEPVELKFSAGRRKEGDASAPLIVDAALSSAALGDIWLKTVLKQPSSVWVSVWAERTETAEVARSAETALRQSLQAKGLMLAHMAVFNDKRPTAPERLAVSGRLIDIDV